MIRLKESGMIFEFDDNNCYCIEKDPLVEKSNCASTSNNKGCECVSFINGYHCFIEAKSSAPRGRIGNVEDVRLNNEPLPHNWEIYDNYQHFLRDISKKFIDSFFILRSLVEGVHGEERYRDVMLKDKNLKYNAIRFILIINFPANPDRAVDKQGLVTLNEALKNEMRPFLNVWRIPDTSIKVVLPADASKILNIPVALE